MTVGRAFAKGRFKQSLLETREAKLTWSSLEEALLLSLPGNVVSRGSQARAQILLRCVSYSSKPKGPGNEACGPGMAATAWRSGALTSVDCRAHTARGLRHQTEQTYQSEAE